MPADGCLHAAFEGQATQTPDAPALISSGERMTYADLDRRADLLAQHLADTGVRPGDMVGILLERGLGLVVAALAALKAGAAYLMLDPAFPAVRLREMVERANVRTVVGDCQREAGLGSSCLQVSPRAVGSRPLPRGAVMALSHDIACVMFTSGSKGRPKGVAVSHAAIVRTLLHQPVFGFEAGSTWLQCAPVSWDAFAMELWGPLLHGGTVVLYPPQRVDPSTIECMVKEHCIDTMYVSSSLFSVIVDERPAALGRISRLLVGGEPLSPAHAQRALARWPKLKLVNGYGPVENTIFITSHLVSSADAAGNSVPVGRPLAGKDVYVLDQSLRPVAQGEVGELYARGDGIALGYIANPVQTAERFVADPRGAPGARMYRTGDLARQREDGVLEFLGRADRQLKIRGFRIEPSEVEAVLARHPAVERVAVAAERSSTSEPLLTAYVVLGRAVRTGELREYAGSALPEFMVPAAFVTVDALPLTSTGKLDYRALGKLGLGGSTSGAPAGGSVCLRDAWPRLEQRVAAIWREVLGVDEVGPDDDFFALGGTSLAAIRVAMRIADTEQLPVTSDIVFTAPSIASLCRELASLPHHSDRSAATWT